MGKASSISAVKSWFSHPLVGVSGTIASVISIPLAIWFYLQSVPSRELVVIEPAIRSVFVNADAPAGLAVSVNGEAVSKQDVFAAQFAIWNRGNQSIRSENVLEPVVFTPPPDVRVIEAKVLRFTRTVCELAAHSAPDGKEARVEWRILEPGDGAIVQLLLVGNQSCRIGLSATIEGGGKPRYVHLQAPSDKAAQQAWLGSRTLTDWLVQIGLFVLFALAFITSLFVYVPAAWRKTGKERHREILQTGAMTVIFGVFTLAIGTILYNDVFRSYHVPPLLLNTSSGSVPTP